MKIYLICAFVCLAGLAHGATIQRIARDTGAIIPTIVEEILKSELQSDLKKNSAIEIAESEPLIKEEIKTEIVVEPLASRTVPDGQLPLETAEKIIAVESLPLLTPVEVAEIKEELKEIKEEAIKEELIKEIKEEMSLTPVLLPKAEPAAEFILKEEIVIPMTRNVVKEEIPQIEELRNVLPEETIAVKEVLPEPIASLNIVQPVIEVEELIKTIAVEPVKEIKEETPLAPEGKADLPLTSEIKAELPLGQEIKAELLLASEIKEEAPLASEMKAELPLAPEIKSELPLAPEIKSELPLAPEIKSELPLKEEIKAELPLVAEIKSELPLKEEIKATPEIKEETISEIKSTIESKPILETVAAPEIKEKLEGVAPVIAEQDSEIRQDRPTLVQNIQDALTNVPIVGQIFNRNPAVADETVSDESTATTVRPNPVVQVFQNTQLAIQNALNALNPAANNAASAEGAEGATSRPPSPLQGALLFAQNAIQNAVSNANNILRPQAAAAATTAAPVVAAAEVVDDEKPVKADEKVKFVEPEPQIAVQKEVAEPQKVVVEEEKENVVKN